MASNENTSNKTEDTNGAPKMRRIRNHNKRSNNPAAMFAAGLESLVSDQLNNSSKYDDDELNAMERKTNRKALPESLFSILCRQLLWGKLAR